MQFLNHYRCDNDGTEWSDVWSCACNDKCPNCNREIEPHRSDEINARKAPVPIDPGGATPERGGRRSVKKLQLGKRQRRSSSR